MTQLQWVKASERLPDSADTWFASNKHQEGRILLCKVNGEQGIGYFWKAKGEMHFTYTKVVSGMLDGAPYWKTEDGYVPYKDFHKIEWLDEETESPSSIEGEEKVLADQFEEIMEQEIWLNNPFCDSIPHDKQPQIRDIRDAAIRCAELVLSSSPSPAPLITEAEEKKEPWVSDKCASCKHMEVYTLGNDEVGGGNCDARCRKGHWYGLGEPGNKPETDLWANCEDYSATTPDLGRGDRLHWVRCSERMPVALDEVIYRDIKTKAFFNYYHGHNDDTVFFEGRNDDIYAPIETTEWLEEITPLPDKGRAFNR